MPKNKHRSPKEQDIELGFRIRKLRQDKKLSLDKVAAAIAVSKQQLRKYELGRNKISACRLGQIATILGVHADDLIRDTPAKFSELDREAERLWMSISDPQQKHIVLAMMKAAANNNSQYEPEVSK